MTKVKTLYLRVEVYALFILWCLLVAPWMIYVTTDVRNYISVSAITVDDTPEGSPVAVDVERILRRDFPGTYTVTIRQSGYTICETGRVDLRYQRFEDDGTLRQLPEPVTLDWWAHGGTCTELLAQGLPPGHYTEETCHGVRRLWGLLPAKMLCWPATTFSILEQVNG